MKRRIITWFFLKRKTTKNKIYAINVGKEGLNFGKTGMVHDEIYDYCFCSETQLSYIQKVRQYQEMSTHMLRKGVRRPEWEVEIC